MARNEHLPIYKAGFGLCLYFEQIVRGFSRYHKYGLGSDLRDGSRRVLRLIVRANARTDKVSVLLEVREEVEELKVLLRLCHEARALPNMNSFEQAAGLLVSIAKQNEGWIKSQRIPDRGRNRSAIPEGTAGPGEPCPRGPPSAHPGASVPGRAIAEAPRRGGGTRAFYPAAAGLRARVHECAVPTRKAAMSREQAKGANAASNYWSASTNATNPNNAWKLNTNNGNANNNNKTNDNYVRAVRSGSWSVWKSREAGRSFGAFRLPSLLVRRRLALRERDRRPLLLREHPAPVPHLPLQQTQHAQRPGFRGECRGQRAGPASRTACPQVSPGHVDLFHQQRCQAARSVRGRLSRPRGADLRCEKGFRAIIDEAGFHLSADSDAHQTFVAQLVGLSNHFERAMVAFLDHNKFWRGATCFYHADSLPYWRKRKNLPHQPAAVDDTSVEDLATRIRTYFHHTEGRGNNCYVDPLRRGDLDYFFAYPEDYSQQSIEWVSGKFGRRPHNPAFEVIYVYSRKKGSLDVNFRGSPKAIEPLQAMFCAAILKLPDLPPDPKDGRVYDLNALRDKGFEFVYDAGSGIQRMVVKKLRLSSKAKGGDRITVEAETSANPQAVYDLLGEIGKSLALHLYNVTQVELAASVIVSATKPPKAITIRITHPNSCSLKYDEVDLKLRDMLSASGIEPIDPEGVEEADEANDA